LKSAAEKGRDGKLLVITLMHYNALTGDVDISRGHISGTQRSPKVPVFLPYGNGGGDAQRRPSPLSPTLPLGRRFRTRPVKG